MRLRARPRQRMVGFKWPPHIAPGRAGRRPPGSAAARPSRAGHSARPARPAGRHGLCWLPDEVASLPGASSTIRLQDGAGLPRRACPRPGFDPDGAGCAHTHLLSSRPQRHPRRLAPTWVEIPAGALPVLHQPATRRSGARPRGPGRRQPARQVQVEGARALDALRAALGRAPDAIGGNTAVERGLYSLARRLFYSAPDGGEAEACRQIKRVAGALVTVTDLTTRWRPRLIDRRARRASARLRLDLRAAFPTQAHGDRMAKTRQLVFDAISAAAGYIIGRAHGGLRWVVLWRRPGDDGPGGIDPSGRWRPRSVLQNYPTCWRPHMRHPRPAAPFKRCSSPEHRGQGFHRARLFQRPALRLPDLRTVRAAQHGHDLPGHAQNLRKARAAACGPKALRGQAEMRVVGQAWERTHARPARAAISARAPPLNRKSGHLGLDQRFHRRGQRAPAGLERLTVWKPCFARRRGRCASGPIGRS